MFAILIKENYNILRYFTMKGRYRSLHQSVFYMNSRSGSKHEHEEDEDDDDDEDCEEETPSAKRVCPPDPCKPQPSTGPCLPPPPPPPGAVGMPRFLGAIGPKQISVIVAFIPCLLRYGVVALVSLIYFTEFKTLLQYLPFYGGKYEIDDEKPTTAIKKEEELEEGIKADKKDC